MPKTEHTHHYRLCPKCARAVPVQLQERYCINDGTVLLEACPVCESSIGSPYARFCGTCGFEYALVHPSGVRTTM